MDKPDTRSTEDMIREERKQLDNDGILYEFKMIGSKYFAAIEFTNGKKARYCCYRKDIFYNKKTYHVKRLKNWIKKNGLEIKL